MTYAQVFCFSLHLPGPFFKESFSIPALDGIWPNFLTALTALVNTLDLQDTNQNFKINQIMYTLILDTTSN